MGLRTISRPRDLFSTAWVDALKGTIEASMIATVRFWSIDGEPIYDPDTDSWTTPTTPVYEGPARVQPLRTATQRNAPGNETTVQAVLFSIPIANKALNLRPELQGEVLVAELMPALATYQYVISEIMDSSNPVERTFLCTVNQETVNG